MAIIVYTDDATALLQDIKKNVADGTIDTWSIDKDGDFTHNPQQWQNKAFLRPSINDRKLRFWIIGRQSVKMTKEVYGVYHGRFSEMLLAHFDTQILRIELSSLPNGGDSL